MARQEIDSFILKFKRLLLSGRNATLVIKLNAEKLKSTSMLSLKMSLFINIVNINIIVGPAVDPPENEENSEDLLLHKRLKNLLRM